MRRSIHVDRGGGVPRVGGLVQAWVAQNVTFPSMHVRPLAAPLNTPACCSPRASRPAATLWQRAGLGGRCSRRSTSCSSFAGSRAAQRRASAQRQSHHGAREARERCCNAIACTASSPPTTCKSRTPCGELLLRSCAAGSSLEPSSSCTVSSDLQTQVLASLCSD